MTSTRIYSRRKQTSGFTLIELMIVVAIVAVLAAVAYGSYLAQVRKARRSDAIALLSAIQQAHCLLYTSPSPRDGLLSRMPSSA